MSIEQIDKQLKEYYQSLQAPYDALFSTYCEENGIDDESMAAELEEEADDSILVDFDPDFPFAKPPKNDSDRNQKILDLIKKCYSNTGLSFAVSMPEINEQLFNVTDSELNDVRKLYKKQCPVLYNSGMENDETFLRILAIGRKHNFDYLQHLVDDYFVARVHNISKTFQESDWSKKHKHIDMIKNFKIKNSKFKPAELAVGAVKSFGARCCPKLLFSNIIEINNSLEITIKYIVAAATWIHSLIKENNSICPFQIDLCLGFGAPSKQESVMSVDDDDDDDDDDDEMDEKGQSSDFFDCIGDINNKLNKNKLNYKLMQNKPKDGEDVKSRMFGQIFNKFREDVSKSNNNKYYPQGNRFIMFCDRRGNDLRPQPKCKLMDDEKYDISKDDIWMYEPAVNCRNIPKDAVPEWYISASRTSILPNVEYGDGKKAEESVKDNNKKDGNEQTKQKLLNANITSLSHCKGSLFTVSFICKESDAIKSYLYWNGQITRFSPEDIREVFPKLFNMQWNDGKPIKKGEKGLNQQFMDDTNEINRLIKILKEKMPDKYFTSFRQSYI